MTLNICFFPFQHKLQVLHQQTYYDSAFNRHGHGLMSLYKQGELCDVEFRVHGDSVMAHKIILCSASNFFRVMFESKFRESEENLVDLSATFSDVNNLRAVLDYIYKGEIFLTPDNVLEVLDISVQFLLQDLQSHCAQFLLERLRPQDALFTWYIARLYDLRELEEISQTLTSNTFCRKLIFNKSIDSLPVTFLASVLQDSSLEINSIDRVELVLHWLSFAFKNRKQDAEELISNYLRQNPLPINYNVENCDTFSEYSSEFQSWLKSRFSVLLQEQQCHLEAISCSVAQTAKQEILSWCLVLQEEDSNSVAFYCTRNKAWISCPLTSECTTLIGFVSPNHLAIRMHGAQVSLIDIMTGGRKPVANILRMLPRRYIIAENTVDFFCSGGSLYILITVFSEPTSKPFFKVYHYQTITDTWDFCMDVHYEFFGDEMTVGDQASVSLKVRTGQGQIHYLMVTITTKRRTETPLMTPNVNGREFRFQEMKNFHVIKLDPIHKVYECCGVRWHDPVSLDQLPTLILSDKICFLKLDHQLLAEKLRMSFINQDECYMDAVCLVLAGHFWEKVTIGVPPPNLTPLPMTIYNETFYKLKVSNLFNKLFVGIHRAPHVYQVAMYDLENFSAAILPPTSLPAVNNISMSVFSLNNAITTLMKGSPKSVDTVSFSFSEFLLKRTF